MPQQKVELTPKGLYTNVNQFGTAPPGSLAETTNVVISRPGVLGCRRGRAVKAFFATRDGNNVWQHSYKPIRIFNPRLRVGGTFDTAFSGTATDGFLVLMDDGTMQWSTDGVNYTRVNPTLGEPLLLLSEEDSDYHYYAFELNGNIYINTASGVIHCGRPLPNTPIASIFNNPPNNQVALDWSKSGYELAGEVFGLETATALDTSVAGTAINADSQVAYRFCFGHRDPNSRLVLGAPSSRSVVINPSNGQLRNAYVRTMIPPDINRKKAFYQVYRTLASSSASTDPGDDCGLVSEASIPQTVNVSTASRTGTTATINTAAAHGLVGGLTPKTVVRIPTDIAAASVDTFTNLLVYVDDTNLKVHQGASPWTLITTKALANLDPDSIKSILLYRSDSISGRTFVVVQGSSDVYVFNKDGTYNTSVSVGSGVYPDMATYNPVENKIELLCHTGAGLSFDYQTAPGVHVEIDCVGLGIAQTISSPLPGNSPTPITAVDAALHCRLGSLRANSTALQYTIVAMMGRVNTACVAISTNNAVSWIRQNLPAYPSQASGNVSSDRYTNVSAGTVAYRKSTGMQNFVFATMMHDPIVGGALHRYAQVWEVVSDGMGYPKINAGYVYSDTTTPANKPGPRIEAIRFNSVTGNGVMAVSRAENLGTVFLGFTSLSAWGASTSGVLTGLVNISGGFTLSDDDAPRATVVFQSGSSPEAFYTYASVRTSNSPVTYEGRAGRYVISPVSFTDLFNIGTLTTPNSTVCGYEGAATSNTPVIAAGAYEVQSVPSTTSFTITSVQSPQTDFASQAVLGTAEASEIVYYDNTGPTFLGAYLYTSPAVEGIINSNYPPPIAEDICSFRTTAFYANTKQRATANCTLLKLPTAGERVYIGGAGQYVTAAAAENITNKQFAIGASGNLNTDLRSTIASLARVVNAYARQFGNVILGIGTSATQVSTFSLTGVNIADSVRIKHTDATGANLIVGTFTPNDFNRSPEQNVNYLYYSKNNQPDAVPLLNYLRIGSDTKKIERIIASRDALFVFKEDGCYIVRGYGPPWQVDPYDLTLDLAIKDSIVATENIIFGAFTRGIFKISDSNVELISLPINDQLERYLVGDKNTLASRYGFGVGDNSDHKFILYLPTQDNIDYCDKAWVYDTFTNEWTTWDMPSRHTIIGRDGLLHHAYEQYCEQVDASGFLCGGTAKGSYPAILTERKSMTDDDFSDEIAYRFPQIPVYDNGPLGSGFLVGLAEYDAAGRRMKLNTTTSTQTPNNLAGVSVKKYDIIMLPTSNLSNFWTVPPTCDSEVAAVVMSDAAPGEWFNIANESLSWVGDGQHINFNVVVFRPIMHGWKFKPAFPGTPAATNHYEELVVSFREAYWTVLDASFELPTEQTDPQVNAATVSFNGISHFGPLRKKSYSNFIRTYVPRQTQRGTVIKLGINTGVCGKNVESNGMLVQMTQGPLSFQRR